MALIDKWEAEEAIRQLTVDMPNANESLCSSMAEARMTYPDCSVESHFEWRETGSVPHFRAVLHWTNEEGYPIVGGDYIHMEIAGTFKEDRKGSLTVKDYRATECYIHDPQEDYVRPV